VRFCGLSAHSCEPSVVREASACQVRKTTLDTRDCKSFCMCDVSKETFTRISQFLHTSLTSTTNRYFRDFREHGFRKKGFGKLVFGKITSGNWLFREMCGNRPDSLIISQKPIHVDLSLLELRSGPQSLHSQNISGRKVVTARYSIPQFPNLFDE